MSHELSLIAASFALEDAFDGAYRNDRRTWKQRDGKPNFFEAACVLRKLGFVIIKKED